MSINLVRFEPDGQQWSGWTGLSGTYEDVCEALFQVMKDDERRLSAATILGWIHEHVEDYPPIRRDRIVPSDLDWANRFGAGFQGWESSMPPRGYYTPPIPFDFVLPTNAPAPLDALKPWWDAVAITQAESAPVAASYSGKKMEFGTWPPDGLDWENGDLIQLSEWCQFAIYPELIQAWVRFDATTARIAQPGLVGSVVPGYGTIKSLASTLSERTESALCGCRIDLECISAITYHMMFNLKPPLLDFRLKEKVKMHGYGENTGLEIGVEFSDGWRPYRVCLKSSGLPYEEEAASLSFVRLLTRMTAERQLKAGYLGDKEREALQAIAVSQPTASEDRGGNYLSRFLRVELPGSRPVSVALSE